ncbi:MAG: SCO family protein [Candidatus Rokuibacteriota bacterium]|nr:MAG: SCO family protein [Candidatus Rokubacteria bacterium]
MGSSAPRRFAESRRTLSALLLAAVAAAAGDVVAGGVAAAHEPDDTVPAAVTMDFVPPPAGSYALHAIMPAPDGPVLDPDGRRLPLSRFTAGKITLLGFIYTSCADARGCPLAYQVFHAVRHRVAEDAALRDRVRLVSLSFDPARDTPAVMRHYAAAAAPNGVEWAFLTTERPGRLVPLLDGFGQDVRIEVDARGRPAGPLAHVLKVFLLDERAIVREIYTTAYLFPEVIVNDIKTLRLEDRPARKAIR